MAMTSDDLEAFLQWVDVRRVYLKQSDGQPMTVSELPDLDASLIGVTAYVRDALLPLYHVAVVGGGSVKTWVMWTGTQWVAS